MKTALRLSVFLMLSNSMLCAQSDWPQFHGPNAQGVAPNGAPPIHFGGDSNLLWKVEVPPGLSCPVVSANRVFLTAQAANRLITLAYDATDGRELWRREAPVEKLESCHPFSSPAASTPCAADGRVLVYFGSFGLLAYDFGGNELWQRPMPTLPTQYGTATSPILASGKLILQRDGNSTNSQLLALDPATGRVLWEVARPLSRESYSTPMVWAHDGLEELIVMGKGRLMSYDLLDGKERWFLTGWGFSAVTTPVAGEGLLFAGGSGTLDPAEPTDPQMTWNSLIGNYDPNKDGLLALEDIPESVGIHLRKDVPKEAPGNYFPVRGMLGWFADTNKDKLISKEEWDEFDGFMKDKRNTDRFVAIRPGGRGNISGSHVAWETTRGLSEMPSPLFYGGRVYWIRDGGLLTMVQPRTGARILDRERVGTGGQYIASPLGAGGHIYIANEAGTVSVLQAGDQLNVLARNPLGESIRATPAIAGDTLYVRSAGHLWAFRDLSKSKR